jgi:hypothetical protein
MIDQQSATGQFLVEPAVVEQLEVLLMPPVDLAVKLAVLSFKEKAAGIAK